MAYTDRGFPPGRIGGAGAVASTGSDEGEKGPGKKEGRPLRKLAILSTVFIAACAVRSAHDTSFVSASLREKTGHEIRFPGDTGGGFDLPTGVVLEDGLSSEEAVAVALWNNPQFQADVAALGFAKADLLEAGLLRNPILSFLFPLGPKQLEATLSLPLDFFLQRPRRVAAAKLDVERVAESLIQHGLDLTREVLISHADLVLARARRSILTEHARLLGETASIAAARLKAGDISGLEEEAFRLEAALAQEESVHSARDARIAEEKLKAFLGLGLTSLSFEPACAPPESGPDFDSSDLLESAFAARPDLRAAEIAIEGAAKRLGWERSKILNLTATLDANGEGKEGFEMGPGFVLELPVFNWNDGKAARARAEMKQAASQYIAVRQRIAREVNEAHAAYSAARRNLEIVSVGLLPSAKAAGGKAGKAYSAGEISYLELLVFEQGILEACLRAAETEAELRRAEAALQHSVGLRLPGLHSDIMTAGEK